MVHLSMNDFVPSLIGNLENICSLSYVELLNVGTLHYTMPKNHVTIAIDMIFKSLKVFQNSIFA